MKRTRIITISVELSSRSISDQKVLVSNTPKRKKVNKPSPILEELQHEEEFHARLFFHNGEEYIKVIGEFKFNTKE